MNIIHFYVYCIGPDQLYWYGFFAASNFRVLAKTLKKRGAVEAFDITTEEVSRIL